jgi:hypothetical protein
MATGRLSTPVQLGATNTTLYTVPTGFYAVFNVSLTNTGTSAVTIRLAVASTTSPGITEWIEYDQAIPPKSTFERTGLVAQAGLNCVALSNIAAQVSATVYGIETSIL